MVLHASSPSEERPITVDVSGRILLTTFYMGATDDQYAAYLDEFTRCMLETVDRHGRVANIIDASRWHRSSATQRQMHAQWIDLHRDYIASYTAGIAFVVKSPLVRGGLTAILWLSGMPAPHKVMSTLEAAEHWALSQLSDVPSQAVGS